MSIYEVLVIVTFVICTIMMNSQYIDSEVPRVCDVLQKNKEDIKWENQA